MDLTRYKVKPLASEHIHEVTSFWRASLISVLGIEPVHSFESQAYFLEHILPSRYQVFVVVTVGTSRPVAFMASSHEEINQLYVSSDHRSQGIGGYLLNLAKEQSTGSLSLRTFDINKRAQRFYQSHGFRIQVGNCENEEGLLDLVCHWNN